MRGEHAVRRATGSVEQQGQLDVCDQSERYVKAVGENGDLRVSEYEFEMVVVFA